MFRTSLTSSYCSGKISPDSSDGIYVIICKQTLSFYNDIYGHLLIVKFRI